MSSHPWFLFFGQPLNAKKKQSGPNRVSPNETSPIPPDQFLFLFISGCSPANCFDFFPFAFFLLRQGKKKKKKKLLKIDVHDILLEVDRMRELHMVFVRRNVQGSKHGVSPACFLALTRAAVSVRSERLSARDQSAKGVYKSLLASACIHVSGWCTKSSRSLTRLSRCDY